jgi:hypothetical protein
MTQSSVLHAPAPENDTAFVDFDRAVLESGPGAALDQLIDDLTERGEYRTLLDALLLKARRDLGLPLLSSGSLNDLSEPTRSQYEDRYVEAIRVVGGKLLAAGEIVAAWPYFRAIGEKDRVAEALEAYQPTAGDERLGQIVEIAFNQGAHPRKGFALILESYGTCSAISAFEQLPPDEATRVVCADRLVRNLHEQLVANLRGEIARKGQPLPLEGTPVAGLLAGRPWMMADDAYHIDTSHLAATVRISIMLTDPVTLGLAVELTDYGRHLSSMHRYESDPPFDRLYEDHAVYLRALLGQGVEAGIAHFEKKLPPPDIDGDGDTQCAQVLVRLLLRLGRVDQAIDVAGKHLAGFPDGALAVPGVASLCQQAGRPDRLAKISRETGDLVNYAAAVLQMEVAGETGADSG